MEPGARKRLLDFKRHLRAEISEGDGAYLFSERGVITMQGERIAALAALLDGTRDFELVLRSRPAGMNSEQVAGLLAQLVEQDLVTWRAPGELGVDEPALAYWDACGVDVDTAAISAKPASVSLIGLGDGLGSLSVERALAEAGLAVVRRPAEADLSVVLCDDYLDPRLAEIDTEHRRTGRPWLLAKPAGSQVWLGPIVRPGESACWHCLTNRLWGHRHAEACAQASLGHHGPASRPVPSLPPLVSAAAHLIALEATKWLAGYRYPGQGCVWVLDSLDLQGQLHELRRRPQCPECGDPGLMAKRASRPVVLNPALKISCTGGGHRTLTAEQVLERYRHLISPVTGVVKEVTRDTRGPAFVNAYRSGPNVMRGRVGMSALRASLRGENGGKGASPIDAEVGALCEAVERFSGIYQGDELRVPGSLRSLGTDALHPNDCLLYAREQYRTRKKWNATHSLVQWVCEPFDDKTVMNWTPLWSLTESRQRLLPTGLLYYGGPEEGGKRCVRADSNGNAAGSSVEDAILQGMLELIERDAVALWWYNRTPLPGVDLTTFGDSWIEEMTARYAGVGRELWALDATSDLGVPVMVAASRRTGLASEEILFGFGAHLDPRMALRRAVTELNQMLPAAGGAAALDDPDAARWLRHATVANQSYLRPADGVAARTPSDFGFLHRADVRDDVTALVRTFAGHGMETLVLDQTRPDIELPVVKVVVPGLRSFWARFAPGRLFDVPVRLGRLAEPTAYRDLNPYPMFL